MKKLNKEQELKRTISALEYQLDRAKDDKKELTERNSYLEEQLKHIRSVGDMKLSIAERHSRDLLEIIRWNSNPETAKHPFKIEGSSDYTAVSANSF